MKDKSAGITMNACFRREFCELRSQVTKHTDGRWYLRKKHDATGEDLRYDPSKGILEIGKRGAPDSEWRVFDQFIYGVDFY